MNILFISPNLPHNSVGGVERYIANLINYAKKQTTTNVVLMLPTNTENSSEKSGYLTTYFDQTLSLSKNAPSKEISEKVRVFAENVENIITTHQIDIICAENFHVGLPPAYNLMINMTAMLHSIPLILRIHSFATTEIQIELINQLMWRRISCVSKSVTGDCFEKGANINILSTDYLGVDTTEFNTVKTEGFLHKSLNLLPKNKILLTATRILRGTKNILQEKGIINLIEAFSKLSPRYPDLRLVIAVGKPTENLHDEFEIAYGMLTGYIKLHNIELKTIIKQFKLNEMSAVYKESDVFVLPSENETFGQVFIEAMSSGLPVIGTKTGGIPEIISDGYNGYLIPPNDASILAQMIEKLTNDRSVRDRFVSAGLKVVSYKFTAEKQFTEFFRTLEKALSFKPF